MITQQPAATAATPHHLRCPATSREAGNNTCKHTHSVEMRPRSTPYHVQSIAPNIRRRPEPPNESSDGTRARATFKPPQTLRRADAITMHTCSRATRSFLFPSSSSPHPPPLLLSSSHRTTQRHSRPKLTPCASSLA